MIRRRLLQLLGSLATAGFVRAELKGQAIQTQPQETKPKTVSSPEPTSSLREVEPVLQQTIKVEWQGDPLDHALTVRDIIYANGSALEFMFQSDAEALWRFYSGEEHWDEYVKAQRDMNRRPTLTVNRLHHIVARAISNSRSLHQEPSPAEVRHCALIVTMRNMDAQRLYNYNYQLSQLAEMMATKPAVGPVYRESRRMW